MNNEELYKELLKISNNSVFPLKDHLTIALDKGKMLAKEYNANPEIVKFGILLMDIKLGEAYENHRLHEHVKMGSDFAKEFLKKSEFTEEEKEKLINCVEAHHGKIPFTCIEAEICANADCYRFIDPVGIYTYTVFLAKRTDDLLKQITELKYKLEEKGKILSLPKAKTELNSYYNFYQKQFNDMIKYIETLRKNNN